MAVRSSVADRFGRRMACFKQRIAMAHFIVNRVVAGGTVCPRVGLLSLPDIFSTGAVDPRARSCIRCSVLSEVPSAYALHNHRRFASSPRIHAFLHRNRSHLIRGLFVDRVSNEQFRRLGDGRISFETDSRIYEVSVVVCDIGNKLTFAEGSEPAAFTEVAAKFIRETAARLVEQGAYLQAADGEGVVGVFGFPAPDPEHERKAARVVLDIIKESRERSEDKEKVGSWDIRAGISSGAIIAGALQESRRPLLLVSGEPIDLARRFCALNRFYGSGALMDTATFDQVNEVVVARPIDFVSGLNSHDRLEVYEPLWIAAEAGPERVAQRDSFWSGVVLYREKRWAEAYAEFQKARGSETEDDQPLQFYLRRLEPLLLQLTQWPGESI